MQEIKKRRIVLASLLKPVDDTRMYEKLGTTLASKYNVHVIGQPASIPLSLNDKGTGSRDIETHPLPPFNRLSLRRLFAPLIVLREVVRLRPDVFVVCTAELLPVALCARLSGAQVVYDVQENYALNILYGNTWPIILRPILALAIRTIEWIASFAMNWFLLAEQCYADELRFIRRDFTILENKIARSTPGTKRERDPRKMHLLFSGTLAETTGVFTAIALARSFHAAGQDIALHIIGYAAKAEVQREIKKAVRDHEFITLTGVDKLVSHRDILEAIRRADFGIVAYPESLLTWRCVPTKLYEYLGSRLPVLLIDNARWTSLCSPYSAAVIFSRDRDQWDALSLLGEMRNRTFYTREPEKVYWDSEAPKLLEAMPGTQNK